MAHLADDPGSPVERPQSQGDAFPSCKFKNSMNTLEQVRAWKEQFPAVSGVSKDSEMVATGCLLTSQFPSSGRGHSTSCRITVSRLSFLLP